MRAGPTQDEGVAAQALCRTRIRPVLASRLGTRCKIGRRGCLCLVMTGRALLAWNLRRVRVAAGVSQERLAADAGVDRAYLGGLERQTENPTVDLLDRVAMTLQVPLSELFLQPAAGETPPQPLPGGRRRR